MKPGQDASKTYADHAYINWIMPRFHLNHEISDPRAPRCDFQKVDPCQKSMVQNFSAPVGPPGLKPGQNASIITKSEQKNTN